MQMKTEDGACDPNDPTPACNLSNVGGSQRRSRERIPFLGRLELPKVQTRLHIPYLFLFHPIIICLQGRPKHFLLLSAEIGRADRGKELVHRVRKRNGAAELSSWKGPMSRTWQRAARGRNAGVLTCTQAHTYSRACTRSAHVRPHKHTRADKHAVCVHATCSRATMHARGPQASKRSHACRQTRGMRACHEPTLTSKRADKQAVLDRRPRADTHAGREVGRCRG